MIYNLFHNEEAERKDKQDGIIIFSGVVKGKKWQTVPRKEQKDKEICELPPLLCFTGKNPVVSC